jgi:hypothetical protein
MRTRFPPGSKGGEQQQENRLGLGRDVRSQGAHSFSGEGVERVLVAYGPERVVGLLCPTEGVPGWAARPLAARPGKAALAACREGGAGLGEQLFRSSFCLCKSREFGRGYVCLQGFYHDSPHWRLLIPGFHREGAVPMRNEAAKGALLAWIATSFRGSLHERVTPERSICDRTGPIGSCCTTALYLEDSLQW